MSKVFVRYTSTVNRAIMQYFPVIASFFLSVLFTVSVVRYVSETQQSDNGKTFYVGKLYASR